VKDVWHVEGNINIFIFYKNIATQQKERKNKVDCGQGSGHMMISSDHMPLTENMSKYICPYPHSQWEACDLDQLAKNIPNAFYFTHFPLIQLTAFKPVLDCSTC